MATRVGDGTDLSGIASAGRGVRVSDGGAIWIHDCDQVGRYGAVKYVPRLTASRIGHISLRRRVREPEGPARQRGWARAGQGFVDRGQPIGRVVQVAQLNTATVGHVQNSSVSHKLVANPIRSFDCETRNG